MIPWIPSVLLATGLAALSGNAVGAFERDEAVFPGRVVDWTVEERTGGPALLVLVEPRTLEDDPGERDEPGASEDEPRDPDPDPLPPCADDDVRSPLTLYRWALLDGVGPVAIRAGLPRDTVRVASVDLDRDGIADTVIDTPRGRVRIGVDAGADRVVLDRAWIAVLDDPRVAAPGPGSLTVFSPDEDGEYREVGQARLRVEASVGRWRTRLRTPVADSRGTTAAGDHLLVTSANAIGTRRVRVDLVRVPDDGPPVVEECWARLPEPEDLLDREVVLFDGVPLLVTTTKEAGKLGLLTEKRIRVHPLRTDRSRLGIEPLLAVESRMNLWQEPRVSSTDVDGDGRDDLAVAYWKGLKDSRVVIDVYLRNADGSFRDKARSTAFDVDEGDRSWLRYGDDLDGDGHADLVVRSRDVLHVHRGQPSAKGAKVVEREPVEIPLEVDDPVGDAVVSVSIGAGGGAVGASATDDGPTIVEFGRARAIAVRGTRDGRDVLRFIRLGPDRD